MQEHDFCVFKNTNFLMYFWILGFVDTVDTVVDKCNGSIDESLRW